MKSTYKELGFDKTQILQNEYGIQIVVGTEGNDDWCVSVPRSLAMKKCPSYRCACDYTLYLVSEKQALATAKIYTEFARKIFGMKGDEK